MRHGLAKKTQFAQTMVPGMEGSFTSSRLHQASLDCALDAGGMGVVGVNAWLQADRGWQRPGHLPHSSGPSILVAKEMHIYFL